MADFQKRILVVDDDLTTIKLIQRYLFHPDNLVLTATSGSQGLQILNEQPVIHVILVDYMMPNMTGVEFIETVRRLEPQPAVIMMSSLTQDEIPAGMRADRFLKKPVSKIHLLEMVEQGVQRFENADGEQNEMTDSSR